MARMYGSTTCSYSSGVSVTCVSRVGATAAIVHESSIQSTWADAYPWPVNVEPEPFDSKFLRMRSLRMRLLAAHVHPHHDPLLLPVLLHVLGSGGIDEVHCDAAVMRKRLAHILRRCERRAGE